MSGFPLTNSGTQFLHHELTANATLLWEHIGFLWPLTWFRTGVDIFDDVFFLQISLLSQSLHATSAMSEDTPPTQILKLFLSLIGGEVVRELHLPQHSTDSDSASVVPLFQPGPNP